MNIKVEQFVIDFERSITSLPETLAVFEDLPVSLQENYIEDITFSVLYAREILANIKELGYSLDIQVSLLESLQKISQYKDELLKLGVPSYIF